MSCICWFVFPPKFDNAMWSREFDGVREKDGASTDPQLFVSVPPALSLELELVYLALSEI